MIPNETNYRLRLLFLFVMNVVFAFVFTKVVAIVTDELPFFSWGPSRWVLFAVMGYVYYKWLRGRIVAAFRNYEYPANYAKVAQDAALSVVVIPLGIVVGRNVFAVVYPWDPFLGAILGAVIATFGWWLFASTGGSSGRGRTPSITVQRGAELSPVEYAVEAAKRLPQDAEIPPFWWAGLWLPFYTESPAALVGSPGTAKTRLLRKTMATVLRHFTPGRDLKAVVFDPKGDFLSERGALGVCCPVLVMNPYDRRAVPWAIGRDVTPARADQVAAALMPDRKHDANPFFYQAARGLVAATFTALAHRMPGRWTLRDLVHVMADPVRLRRFLRSCPATRDSMRQLKITKRVLASVMQEVNNALNLLRPIAALWDSAPEGTEAVSLGEWVRDKGNPSILVFGLRQSKAANCQAINRLMFGILADTILDEPEVKKRSRFWFFLDELADAGQLVGLNDLMRRGRSKGARFFLTFQNIPGLKAHFSDEKVDEITGLVGNLSVLHVDCPTTAEWASRRIGDAEVLAGFTNTGRGITENGRDTTSSENVSSTQSLMTGRAVLQGEILRLGAARPNATVAGFHMLREVNAVYRATLDFTYHDGDPDDDFRPRDDREGELRPWQDADDARLLPFGGAVGDDDADDEEGATGGASRGAPLAPDDPTLSPPDDGITSSAKEAEDALSRLRRIKRMDV
jgi:hypothetical protein